MGFFSNLNEQQIFRQNKFFTPGMYIVKIDNVIFREKGYNGSSFAIECEILDAKNNTDTEAPQEGEHAAQLWRAEGAKKDTARATWMEFLTAVLGNNVKDLTGEQWEDISKKVLDEGAFNGKKMLLEVFNKKTKTGGDYTKHVWLREATQDDIENF